MISSELTWVLASPPGESDSFGLSVPVLLNFDGGGLNPMNLTTREPLYGVSASSATKAHAVGRAGVVLWWDGMRWNQIDSRTSNHLYGTWADAAWSAMMSGTFADLYAVWGRSAMDVWAVGAMGTILHWNGSAWSLVPSGSTAELLHIRGSGAVELWASGRGGTLLRWNGSAWSPLDSGTTEDLYATWQSQDGQAHMLAGDQVRSLIP